MRTLTILALCSTAALAGAQDTAIDAWTRKSVIENAILRLEQYYVFPKIADKMAAAVRAKLNAGEYDNIVDGGAFADQLTMDFQGVSKDSHLDVMFRGRGGNGTARMPQGAGEQGVQADKCGFVTSEVRPGNVGYLKFNAFLHPDACGSVATTAITRLADTDELIIDLRDNTGGRPDMTAYIASYLFDKRTHLNDIWTRYENTTKEFWTRDVPGKKYGGTKPVYVLTSKRTFSGAEEFSYNLKHLKRATLIGETTGGGAHPAKLYPINDRFVILVPFARPINPITKTNWEGSGVAPDVRVPASDALETARKLIADKAKP